MMAPAEGVAAVKIFKKKIIFALHPYSLHTALDVDNFSIGRKNNPWPVNSQ